ncbi:MAG: 4Fe-4S binding protein [Sulfurovum sp.]|nr:4Fe-4S binding protein [Sulfurovum sp.]
MVDFIKRDSSDLFKNPVFAFLFKNSRFLLMLRVAAAALFFYAIYYGFAHPGKENIFTGAVFWGVFWALFMVVTLSTFGRLFCGICPHGFLGKYITKLGLKKSMPKWMRNRYIGITLLVLGWWGIYYTFDGFWKSPFNTALMFGAMTLFAFILYYLYKEMSYCKYICPIGTLTRAYDKISFTKLETYTDACKDCRTFECAAACEYNLKPFTFAKKNQTDDCTLCMDCAASCEAVKFKITKPAEQLSSKLKILSAEVWTYILIFASIPVSMGFAHALNRSNIADAFIWNRTAAFFGMGDYAGGFAFLYAIIISVFFAVFGLYLASKVLKKEYSSTFTTLGVAFIPLFIFASLGHTLEMFFVKEYQTIVHGFAQGFGLNIEVEALAKRGDGWLHYFKLFKWIGVIWALVILYKRIKLIDATKFRKVLGYFFASSMILFYIGLNLYTGYVFSAYGAKSGGHGAHGSHGGKPDYRDAYPKEAAEPQKGGYLQTPIDPGEPFYFSLSDPSMKQNSRSGHGFGGGRPGSKKEVPTQSIWLVYGAMNDKKRYRSSTLDIFYYGLNRQEKPIIEKSSRGKKVLSFEVPHNGYYNLFAVDESQKGSEKFYKVAKLEYLRGMHGAEGKYDPKIKKALHQNRTKIDLVRLKDKDETSFFYKHSMGDTLTFQALFENRPLANAEVEIALQSGWTKALKTDSDGFVSIQLIRDYFPDWNTFDKRFKQEMLITLKHQKAGTHYLLTYPASYYPNSNDYQSYGYALLLITLTLLIAGIIIYRFRRNRTTPFREVTVDAED